MQIANIAYKVPTFPTDQIKDVLPTPFQVGEVMLIGAGLIILKKLVQTRNAITSVNKKTEDVLDLVNVHNYEKAVKKANEVIEITRKFAPKDIQDKVTEIKEDAILLGMRYFREKLDKEIALQHDAHALNTLLRARKFAEENGVAFDLEMKKMDQILTKAADSSIKPLYSKIDGYYKIDRLSEACGCLFALRASLNVLGRTLPQEYLIMESSILNGMLDRIINNNEVSLSVYLGKIKDVTEILTYSNNNNLPVIKTRALNLAFGLNFEMAQALLEEKPECAKQVLELLDVANEDAKALGIGMPAGTRKMRRKANKILSYQKVLMEAYKF